MHRNASETSSLVSLLFAYPNPKGLALRQNKFVYIGQG